MCALEPASVARHRRRLDAAPRLEADAHLDRCSDRHGAGRPRGRPGRGRCRRRRRSGRRGSPAPAAAGASDSSPPSSRRRTKAQARSCERDEDERWRPPLRAGRSRYATTPRRARRNSFQSRKAPSTSEGSLDESSTGSRSSSVSSSSSASSRSSLARAPRGHLLLRQADVRDPAAARVAQRDDDPADVGKALLPDRILDHNRYDVPEVLDGCQPRLAARADRESPRRRRRSSRR